MSGLRGAWAALAPRERRAVLGGAAVVVVAMLGLRGAPRFVRAVEVRRARAEQAVLALARAREALAEQPVARDSLAVRAARLVALAPRLFGGRSPAEAGAEVTSFTSGRGAARGVRILRQDVATDSATAPFLRVRLRLEAEGDVTGLMQWLADLEEGEKLIALSRLTISAPEPGAGVQQMERMRAEVTLVGWSAPELSRPAGPAGDRP